MRGQKKVQGGIPCVKLDNVIKKKKKRTVYRTLSLTTESSGKETDNTTSTEGYSSTRGQVKRSGPEKRGEGKKKKYPALIEWTMKNRGEGRNGGVLRGCILFRGPPDREGIGHKFQPCRICASRAGVDRGEAL